MEEQIIEEQGYSPREQFYMNLPMTFSNRRYNKNIYCAGVLPFHIKNGTTYFLLGKDFEGNWSDFGGKSELKDRGRWDYTAAREFYEETIGSVLDIPSMISRIRNKRISLRIHAKTSSNINYYMFLVKIPYNNNYREIFRSAHSFMKYTERYDYSVGDPIIYKYIEKNDIQWVSLDTIRTQLT